jgi:hypothetical protein
MDEAQTKSPLPRAPDRAALDETCCGMVNEALEWPGEIA